MNWQPIETAPHDRTVLISDGKIVRVAIWDYEEWCTPFQAGYIEITPTHWMPLPEPPA